MRKNGEECSQTCSPWFDECGKKQNARSCGSTLCGKCCEFYGFRQCLDSGYGVVWICHACGKGVDECDPGGGDGGFGPTWPCQRCVEATTTKAVEEDYYEERRLLRERVYLFRIRKIQEFCLQT